MMGLQIFLDPRGFVYILDAAARSRIKPGVNRCRDVKVGFITSYRQARSCHKPQA